MVAKKESNFYDEMQKISEGLSKRKTLAPQLMREYELSQYGIFSQTGVSQLLEYQENKIKMIKELEKRIEEQAKKVEKLNKFSEHMHFMDDQEIVEIYEVIHNEEKILKELKEKLALFKSRLEEKEVSAEK